MIIHRKHVPIYGLNSNAKRSFVREQKFLKIVHLVVVFAAGIIHFLHLKLMIAVNKTVLGL